ncbi:MAG: RecX family transcriptional regulator [Bacilli bacterium]|nr:RecX family transcriptional regulator [Bacilli bacterium]
MKVNKYERLKNGKYKVYLDNEDTVTLYEDVILNNNLILSHQIEDLSTILNENYNYEAYDIAIKYLSVKMRSKKEIKTYLSKYYEDDIVNSTLNKLVKNGLINDSIYVYAYYKDKMNLSNDGPNKIIDYLVKQGIKEEDIKELINVNKEDVYNKLTKLVDKKIKTSKRYSGNILKQRLISYFINLGYDIDMINEILNTKNLTNIEEGIKEYNKLLNKYKDKYDDYKLEAYIRSKLYAKGFDLDEIKRNID